MIQRISSPQQQNQGAEFVSEVKQDARFNPAAERHQNRGKDKR